MAFALAIEVAGDWGGSDREHMRPSIAYFRAKGVLELVRPTTGCRPTCVRPCMVIHLQLVIEPFWRGLTARAGVFDDTLRYATICYGMLRYAKVCYSMLKYATVCYGMLWICYGMLRYAAVCYSMLQYATVCYSMLWYATVCYSMLRCVILPEWSYRLSGTLWPRPATQRRRPSVDWQS